MSDHVDGPRSIGEPAADVTDLFAFASPENPLRTVLGMCVFPSAGENAIFSNVIEHAIVVRRVSVAGVGNATQFQPADEEIRISFRFDVLKRDSAGVAVQRGLCKLPGGRELSLTVNDENGSSSREGDFRVFAGLRSDPFYLAWDVGRLERLPNLLLHDNVLCIVVEFDTRGTLAPANGSLFGVIAETTPIPRPPTPLGYPVRRIDWVGRPEQSNMRLNNPAMPDIDDIRDLWNQQTPFAIPESLQPLFLQRLKDSIATWDRLDGTVDWTPEALNAAAKVFLDDFLLFDVSKPVTDQSHLEIEKSTIEGRPYQTGGGRTINANVIDILLTWLVNHDRKFLQGGATGATKPGTSAFPYFATPNVELQISTETAQLGADADEVWSLIGEFGGAWHPLIARVRLTGQGKGQLRTLETVTGQEIVERLEEVDIEARSYRYQNLTGVAAAHYSGTLSVTPQDGSSVVTWKVEYFADGKPDIVVRTQVASMQKAGLQDLRRRFGASK